MPQIPPNNLHYSQIPGYLGNFPDTQAFGKFPKFLKVFEGGIFLRFWKFLKWLDIWGISQKPRHLGNSPNSYRYLRVVYFKDFGNFSNDWICGESPKNLGIWEIVQISGHLGNSSNVWVFGEFPKDSIPCTEIFF